MERLGRRGEASAILTTAAGDDGLVSFRRQKGCPDGWPWGLMLAYFCVLMFAPFCSPPEGLS